jgi:hypothetical protein
MGQSLIYHDLCTLGIRGRGWPNAGHPYDRLPPHAEAVSPEAVWTQAQHSTGLYVEFETDSPSLATRCLLRLPPPPEAQYVKYLDLYARAADERWRWAGVSQFGFVPSGQTNLVENLPIAWRRYRLYLPLTYAVERLELGLAPDASLHLTPPDTRPPIVIYGTSVVKGSTASRPGMTWPAQLGRLLDWPVWNLGFSGAARCEPALGAILAELDPALYVIDPLPNMSTDLVHRHVRPFLEALLAAHPTTPILLVESRRHAQQWLLQPGYDARRTATCQAWQEVCEKLQAEGAHALHYLAGDPLAHPAHDDLTIDGSHPTDWGNRVIAEMLAPAIRRLLPKELLFAASCDANSSE